MKALREYLRTYHGLPAGASDAAAKRLGRSLVRRGQLTIGEYADFFLFPDSLHDVDQIIEAVAYHEAFLTDQWGENVHRTAHKRLAELDRRLAPIRDTMTGPERARLMRRQHEMTIEVRESLAALTRMNAKAPTPEQVDAVVRHNLPHFLKKGFSTMPTLKDSPVQPAHVFYGASRGGVDVKAPSARYSTKRYTGKHRKTGQEILRDGAPVERPSEREHALTGVYFKHLAIRAGVRECPPLNEHEQDLLKEIYNDHLWVGTVGGREIIGEKLETIYHRKGTDLISDTLSGGTNLVPYFYDTDIVTFPLLNGELFPFVKLTEMNTSNSVHTASIGNVTATWQAAEGSANTIPLQTTDGLVASITMNVFDLSMAITIGRYLLADSPIRLGEEINELMGQRLTAELDKVIAIGDGSTQPQGLNNASGTVAVNAVNSTAGPFEVKDVENMISTLPKQYRAKEPSVCWVMNDATWFRLRGISVSSTDQRRIFGYDYENYMLTNHPVRVQNDLAQNDIFFLKMALYRMYRRMGMALEMSTQGKTLMQANELLITGRARYAGKLVNGAGCAFMQNAPLH